MVVALLIVSVVHPASGVGGASLADDEPIPVLRTFTVREGRDNTRALAVGAIHGVRRIPGATVLYFSLGYAETTRNVSFFALRRRFRPGDRWNDAAWGTQQIIDPAGRRAYRALVDDNARCLCSSATATEDTPGKLFVLYEVLPPLPADVRTVDVAVGFNTIVTNVAVEAGPLTPMVDPARPIELGQGWPRIDSAKVAAAPAKELSIDSLETRVSDLEEEVTTVERPDEISVELATDVLFAVDSAELSPAARARIERAADVVNARASGTISIIGHTDSTGSDSHNLDLSRARAAAVRDSLQPLLTIPDPKISIEGRGEREPLDDNATVEGQRRNRRVAITFRVEQS